MPRPTTTESRILQALAHLDEDQKQKVLDYVLEQRELAQARMLSQLAEALRENMTHSH